MKLDNIIYDVDSLSKAITEQWNSESEVFQAIYPSDAATSLVNVFAAYGSMLQFLLTSALANCYTETAFSEKGIYQLAQTLGNNLHGNVSSQVQVKIKKTNFIGINTTIPSETLFEINGKKFFNPSAILLPSSTDTVSGITLIQGEKITVNKISNGIPNEKFYFSSDFMANHNYVEVYINGEQWNVEESFLPYDKNYILNSSDMNTVVLKTDPDGRSYIKVGDNQLAAMPSSGSQVEIKYVSNEGAAGNIGEINATGSLITSLVYMDNQGNQAELNVEVTTQTTAYGGFSKQSLETLKQTSPYVFASGNRAVRRQDYNAILQNKCGYLASSVWGEYEEAEKLGVYDSIMMNMVYYTGIKTFKEYPYFSVGEITNQYTFNNSLYSRKGFLGSFALQIYNNANTTLKPILLQDTGAKGLLFINNDIDDPRDSLLPDWISSTSTNYIAYLGNDYIVEKGTKYKVNDELIVLDTNDEVVVRVKEINSNGEVLALQIIKKNTTEDFSDDGTKIFNCVYPSSSQGLGTGLSFKMLFKHGYSSNFITTNDIRLGSEEQNNPIENARSDKANTEYYQSLYEPSLLQPVQILLDYGDVPQAIGAVKFKAADLTYGSFPSTFAMFATNKVNENNEMPPTDNIRNSDVWDKIIERKVLTNPLKNTNNAWTDWIATNCFNGKDNNEGNPDWNRYRFYVIEFYSVEENSNDDYRVTIDKIKMLYEEDASLIYYEDNGRIHLNFPVAGSPGPGGTADGYLTTNLINTETYPLYAYNVTLNDITYENGYRNGNILAYIFTSTTTNKTVTFLVKVLSIDNKTYSVTIDNNDYLTGTEEILTPTAVSLDEVDTYTVNLENNGTIVNPSENGGQGYVQGEIVALKNIDDTVSNITARVTSVNAYGQVVSVILTNDLSIGTEYTGEYETVSVYSPESTHGTGLKLTVFSKINTGYYNSEDVNIPGSGGKILITSSKNLQVNASFAGNKIDTDDIIHLDQPILEKYNHFTTYLEFKQPEITQVGITAYVKIANNAPITSGVILQNVKNNIAALFDITPDYIGKGLKLSDIYKAITDTQYVEWTKVTEPIDNFDVSVNGIVMSSYINVIEEIEQYG